MSMDVILSYLAELERHNSRDWYHANKPQLRAAVEAFESLVRRLTLELHAMDEGIPLLEPGALTFKLTRDTRFSHDKSPYLPAFRAHIGPKGKLPIPVGYYLQLRPGGRSFLGGGLFADLFREATDMVRNAIAADGDAWSGILSDPGFRSRFTVGGTALKNVPRGFDPAHPQAEFLKYKSWYLEFPVPDRRLLEPDFPEFAVETFAAMRPFNDFLNRALADFRMPERP